MGRYIIMRVLAAIVTLLVVLLLLHLFRELMVPTARASQADTAEIEDRSANASFHDHVDGWIEARLSER